MSTFPENYQTPLCSSATNPLPHSNTKGRRRRKRSSRRRRNRKQNDKPNWLDLPRDVTLSILQRVGSIDVLKNVQWVCTLWWNLCKDPSLWSKIDMHNSDDFSYDIDGMCRHAVDRSHGQLLDINIEYFGKDELLRYISNRSSQLRCLRLVWCRVSSECMSEAVMKLPLLEELHLYFTSIDYKAIETIGRCCPLLKSFKLNDRGQRSGYIECDDEAFSIAKSMPELRHLQLLGNRMTNLGLEAILDSCNCLESLDLRRCFNLSIEGALGQRCSKQIKNLRRPHDSTDDNEFGTDFYSFDEDTCGSLSLSGFSDLDLYDDDFDFCDPYYYDDFCDPYRYNSDFTEYDGMPW